MKTIFKVICEFFLFLLIPLLLISIIIGFIWYIIKIGFVCGDHYCAKTIDNLK